MILRTYTLQVANSSTESFLTALDVLAAALEGIRGFESTKLFRNLDAPDEYVFTERWLSLADHKACAQQLPGTIFTSLMNTLSGPPKAAYLAPVASSILFGRALWSKPKECAQWSKCGLLGGVQESHRLGHSASRGHYTTGSQSRRGRASGSSSNPNGRHHSRASPIMAPPRASTVA